MKKLLFILFLVWCNIGCATTYYVDATGGLDTNTGTIIAPWQTITKVNSSTSAGDTVLFKKGETWREQLNPVSGTGSETANILTADTSGYTTYGAYGTGAKPLILGSYQKNDTSDWTDEGSHIWSHRPENQGVGNEIITNPTFGANINGWTVYFNAADSAAGTSEWEASDGSPDNGCWKITVTNNGDSEADIQCYSNSNQNFSLTSGKIYKLSFKAKASEAFTLGYVTLQKQTSPWTAYYSERSKYEPTITTDWAEYHVYFLVNATASDARINITLGESIPDGAILYLDTISIKACNETEFLYTDVGNIIFNDEESCGNKEKYESDLDTQGDYWWGRPIDELYDTNDDWVLKVYSTSNPASYYSNIEVARSEFYALGDLTGNYFILGNLDCRYNGSGFQQTGHHQIIRDCDFSYIGGRQQQGSVYARAGNGPGYYTSSVTAHNHLVERCRIDNMYDAGISPQGGDGAYSVYNLYYRNNVISRCHYSYEQFYGIGSSVNNIYFENNTCVNCGSGFGSVNRWNPTAAKHFRIGDHTGVTMSNLYSRNNIFNEVATTDGILGEMIYFTLTPQITYWNLSNNSYYSATSCYLVELNVAGPNVFYNFDAAGLADWQTDYSQDANSIITDPLFISTSDYHLKSTSPCKDVGVTLLDVTDDYEGNKRPLGAGYEIGAYEFFKNRIPNATIKKFN